MCGIYGFGGSPKDPHKVAALMRQLAVETEERGTHSTGYVATNAEDYYFAKKAIRAKEFVRYYDMTSPIVKGNVSFFVGHNRWASVGEINDKNAHPFKGKRYFLVHNGTCSGAPTMAKAAGLELQGATDSEAVLRLLEHHGGVKAVKDLMNQFNDYSIVLVDYAKGKDSLYFMRDDGKPMVIFDLRKELGIRVFASTRSILKRALMATKVVSEKVINHVIEKAWSTREGHLYSMDITGEMTNLGDYMTPETRERRAARRRLLTTTEPVYSYPTGDWDEQAYNYYNGLGLPTYSPVTSVGDYYARQMGDTLRDRACNKDYRVNRRRAGVSNKIVRKAVVKTLH